MASAVDSGAGGSIAAGEDSGLNGGAGGGGGAGPSSEPLLLPGDAPPAYQYSQEISQMMFVFGDIEDPPDDVLKLIEDIVRTQVVEMIIQSRRIAQRRASRTLSPEDLIFLIRYDRAKVNRLRIYLSWREVRKKAKESDDVGGGAAGDAELEDAGAMDALKTRKLNVKLPWELSTIFSEHLRPLAGDDADEEDEDDIEAHEDSLTRLKEADEATRRMTREEYVHYSECRQASFTFKKSKRFRDFINAPAYLDGSKPNDDIIDILGFLAFEVVRELCEGALEVQKELQETARILAERKALAAEALKPTQREKGTRQIWAEKKASSSSAATTTETKSDVALIAGPFSSPTAQRTSAGKTGSPKSKSVEQAPSVVDTTPNGILKVPGSNGPKPASSTSAVEEANNASQETGGNRPRKRARFTEPAEQSSHGEPLPTSSAASTGPFASPAANFDRGTPLSSSRAHDSFELPPQLSSLFLPRPGVAADPNDASTFCALFAPAAGGNSFDGSSTNVSPSPSPAMSSIGQFGGPSVAVAVAQSSNGSPALLSKKRARSGEENGEGDEDADGGSDADDAEEAETGKEVIGSVNTNGREDSATGTNKTGVGATADAKRGKGKQDIEGGSGKGGEVTDAKGQADDNNDNNDNAASSSRRQKPPPPQLAISHIYEAFARLQRRRTALAGSARTGGTGGLRRTRMFVI
ncbi:hypothetical protein CF327_g4966 [Tilletia walkeri]|uniref:Transcription initiation protein SPT3 n=1 Tax=Tilletia walkeri TaxID=117179 RepID=A0A8X7T4S5_9BASI|nr:hypothetical protein CF327_g4966 [Tilletia walkeri]KAE8267648.1 hypothetical protein A4X09_0g4706 [Tilletia walkeri]